MTLSETQKKIVIDLAQERINLHEAEIVALQPMLQQAKQSQGFDDVESAIRFAAQQEATIIIAKGEIAIYKRLIHSMQAEEAK